MEKSAMEILKEKCTKDTVKKILQDLADEKYGAFISAITPNAGKVLGVRLPILRKIGKEIARGDWRGYLAEADDEYFDEIMLQGIVIGLVNTGIEEKLRLVENFIPKISNWAVCDSFCAGLKFAEKCKSRVWEFLQPYFNSDMEFEIRFAVVMLINYFITDEYLSFLPHLFNSTKHDGYYVKMAVAWAISTCYVRFPEQTMAYLKNNMLDDFTYNMAIQKIIESRKTEPEIRNILRSMKRR